MPIIHVAIILGISFCIPLASLSPFISADGRQALYELWINTGLPLNIGLCIGLFMGSDMEAKHTQRVKNEIKEAIREGLKKIQNNS
jgi:hypothetical protein